MGAGDGRFALARAIAHERELVIAVDASRDAMRETSRRAERRGLRNVLFVVCSAEGMSPAMAGMTNQLVIHFPWGSLLRGVAGEPTLIARLAALVAPGGRVSLLLSAAARDGSRGLTVVDPVAIAHSWELLGFDVTTTRPASLEDAIELHSSWGKRLLAARGQGRSAWRIGLVRPPASNDRRG